MKKFILMAVLLCGTGVLMAQQEPKAPKGKAAAQQQVTAKYACPMHAAITSNKPGKCSRCGMDLVMQKTYACPMHPDQVSNKPGTCPKCKMTLVEKKSSTGKGGKTGA